MGGIFLQTENCCMKINILLSKLSADCVSPRNGDMFETTTDNISEEDLQVKGFVNTCHLGFIPCLTILLNLLNLV